MDSLLYLHYSSTKLIFKRFDNRRYREVKIEACRSSIKEEKKKLNLSPKALELVAEKFASFVSCLIIYLILYHRIIFLKSKINKMEQSTFIPMSIRTWGFSHLGVLNTALEYTLSCLG